LQPYGQYTEPSTSVERLRAVVSAAGRRPDRTSSRFASADRTHDAPRFERSRRKVTRLQAHEVAQLESSLVAGS